MQYSKVTFTCTKSFIRHDLHYLIICLTGTYITSKNVFFESSML